MHNKPVSIRRQSDADHGRTEPGGARLAQGPAEARTVCASRATCVMSHKSSPNRRCRYLTASMAVATRKLADDGFRPDFIDQFCRYCINRQCECFF